MSDPVDPAVAAILAGELAIVPTDTVYGLAATAYRAEPVRCLYAVKGRAATQPTALVAPSVAVLLDCLPELRLGWAPALRALLPGAFTLVVPNPAGRFAWLCGERPEAIGVRVPAVSGVARQLLERAGAIAATSANLPGGPDPRTLADVPAALTERVAATLDGGVLVGVPSTVIDLTGPRPVVLREGAVPGAETLARLEPFTESLREGDPPLTGAP